MSSSFNLVLLKIKCNIIPYKLYYINQFLYGFSKLYNFYPQVFQQPLKIFYFCSDFELNNLFYGIKA